MCNYRVYCAVHLHSETPRIQIRVATLAVGRLNKPIEDKAKCIVPPTPPSPR